MYYNCLMKKELKEMKEFVERTFAGVGKSKVRQGKKGKGKKGGNK